jgi:signal peptidase I
MIGPLRKILKWLAEPAAILLLAFGTTTAIAQPFYVPSGSMEPTLRIGDAMIASKFAYGFSAASLPMNLGSPGGTRLLGRNPQQGDVVIFRHPKDSRMVLVKRVIGLPGDRVQMRQGHLIINGRMLELQATGMGEAENQWGEKSAIRQFVEILPNGMRHPVFKRQWDGVVDDTRAVTVPAGHIFVMGDNRDNSLDSRVAPQDGGVGLVPAANLIGRAEFVIGSFDFLNMRGPASWPGLVRLSRFFQKIT